MLLIFRTICFSLFILGIINAQAGDIVDPVAVLDVHNQLRNQLNRGEVPGQPIPNPFLQDMSWNESLVETARAHTEQCRFQHSGRAGENIYAHSLDYGDIVEGIRLWTEEYQYYDYDTNSSTNGSLIGHYTQVVWDRSTQVGCASTRCMAIYDSRGKKMWMGTIYTCHYNEPGNYLGQQPYKRSANLSENIKISSANFYSANGNLLIPYIKVGDYYYRAKLDRIDSNDGSWSFALIAFAATELPENTELSTIASFDGQILSIPKVQLDDADEYYALSLQLNSGNYQLSSIRSVIE